MTSNKCTGCNMINHCHISMNMQYKGFNYCKKLSLCPCVECLVKVVCQQDRLCSNRITYSRYFYATINNRIS